MYCLCIRPARIHIHDATITAPFDSPNTDGIDPDSSRDVLIENNVIGCGDDYVTIKSGFHAVTVTHRQSGLIMPRT